MSKRLIFAAVSFAATLGLVLIFDKGSKPDPDEQLAQIIQTQQSSPQETQLEDPPEATQEIQIGHQTMIPAASKTIPKASATKTVTLPPTITTTVRPTNTPTKIPTPSPTKTPTPVAAVQQTPTPTPEPTISPMLEPAPTPETPTPEPATPTPTPITSHVFYTSSRSNSTKYYCDTDSGWKDLSSTYLKSFNSEAELLVVYPTKTLNKPCK